jgi:vanillate O-demethylase ferredoxin subunit
VADLAVRVAEVIDETPDIRSLRLVHLDERPFGCFEAGAHVDVVGPTGMLRQYSLCSAPNDPSSILIAVKREKDSRGGSVALHDVRAGDQITIGKPRNLVEIAADADRHLLVAGGIGVTPLLSMAYELHNRGAEFELHYFVRSREEAAFLGILEERVEFRERVFLHVGVPRDRQPETIGAALAGFTPASHVYTCGPDGFMAQVVDTTGRLVPTGQIHLEHFEAAEIDSSGDTGFTIELDTGEVFDVPPDKSILSVLTDNGVEVFKSCEEGICGSCVSGVLEGCPDHRDNCLSAADKEAGDQMALCVSRALTPRLVIELY